LSDIVDAIEGCYALNRAATKAESGIISLSEKILKAFDDNPAPFISVTDQGGASKITQMIEKNIRAFVQQMQRKHRKRRFNEN